MLLFIPKMEHTMYKADLRISDLVLASLASSAAAAAATTKWKESSLGTTRLSWWARAVDSTTRVGREGRSDVNADNGEKSQQ